jgi:flagellin-like protein
MKTALQTKRRKAISTIIATILVVAMTIVAAGVLYTYFSTTASRAQNTDQIQVSASLAVPGGTGTGTLVVSVVNSGSIALTSVATTGTSTCSIANSGFTPTPSGSAPIAPGSGTSANCQTTGTVTSGVSYTMTVAATFANGATQTQVVTVTAQ